MLSVALEDNHLSSIENREDTPREEGKVYNMKKFPEPPSLSQSLSVSNNTVYFTCAWEC